MRRRKFEAPFNSLSKRYMRKEFDAFAQAKSRTAVSSMLWLSRLGRVNQRVKMEKSFPC